MIFEAIVIYAALASSTLQSIESDTASDRLSIFQTYSEDSDIRIDYEVWTGLLDDIVFEVGHSDRRTPTRPAIVTGSRISPESNSRYRYEGNRVIFHLLASEYDDAISQYRQELEALPSQAPLHTLSSNQQLAYWLNLHNVVLIDELNQRYPVGSVRSVRIDGERLLEAQLITIEGVSLSLNDIRLRIVAQGWDDPRVIYGFFTGAIGGPSINDQAFDGDRVWSQLEANAREYVNALRGVDHRNGVALISPYYQDYPTLFPTPQSLIEHLNTYASSTVSSLLSRVDDDLDYLRFDWSIADLTDGRTSCKGNSGNPLLYRDGRSASMTCSTLPPHAQRLVQVVIERRLRFLRNGDLGRVTVRDIPTQDPDDTPAQPSNSN